MADIIKSIFTSPLGSFGFVFGVFVVVVWGVYFVTKHITIIRTEHGSLKETGAKLAQAVEYIQRDIMWMKIVMETKGAPAMDIAKSHSPISLTELGEELKKELGAEEAVGRNWDKIDSDITINVKDKNPYDIQQYCMETAAVTPEAFLSKEEVDKVKLFAYKKGRPFVSLSTIFALIIRDKYLQIHNITTSDKKEAKNAKA